MYPDFGPPQGTFGFFKDNLHCRNRVSAGNKIAKPFDILLVEGFENRDNGLALWAVCATVRPGIVAKISEFRS
jgi:hypothetical protein